MEKMNKYKNISQMNKSKISMNPFVKFLRELLVVVTGITITLCAGLWVNNNNNKKDLKQYLTAVKMELESNAEMLDYYANWLQKSTGYAGYIKSQDTKSLNIDTLNYYYQTDDYGCGIYYPHSPQIFKTNAFEMVKTSGIMRQLNDKELMESIWGAYAKLEDTRQFLDMCFQIKKEEMMKEKQLELDGKPVSIPMQVFYSVGFAYDMEQRCKQTAEIFKEAALKLKEY